MCAGEIHALIAPNGAGETTPITQVAGGLAPDGGQVRIMGCNVTQASAVAPARMGLARIFQFLALAMDQTVQQKTRCWGRWVRGGVSLRSPLTDGGLRARHSVA